MPPGPRLPRWLFRLTCATALALTLMVVLAPLLEGWVADPGWARLLALFAHDPAVRRTSLASALGLVVTAFVFFGPPARPQP
jgi:hypothetical protein